MDIIKLIGELCYLGGRASKQGYITERVLDKDGKPIESPIMVDGLHAVVPTAFQTSGEVDPLWKERMIFNPLSENIASDVPTSAFRCMLDGLQFRLNVTLRVLVGEVLRLAASTEAQKEMTSKQMEFISQLEGIDEQTAQFFENTILPRTAKLPEYLFVKFFPKHLGTIGETQYSRVTHVSFPLYEGLTGDRKFGVSTALPKGVSLKLASVIKAILGDVDVPDWYSAGSNSRVAPFAESTICAFIKLVSDVRRVQLVFPKLWEGLDEPERFGVYDLRPIEPLRNCDALSDDIRSVPAAATPRSSQSVNPADLAASMPRQETQTRRDDRRNDEYDTTRRETTRRDERPSTRGRDDRDDRGGRYDDRRTSSRYADERDDDTISLNEAISMVSRNGDSRGRRGESYYDDRRDYRRDDRRSYRR